MCLLVVKRSGVSRRTRGEGKEKDGKNVGGCGRKNSVKEGWID